MAQSGERTILQQFSFDIVYRPASQMVVPDALSKCRVALKDTAPSPDEEDVNFPYATEQQRVISLPSGHNISEIFQNLHTDSDSDTYAVCQNMQVVHPIELCDDGYDGDTDDLAEDILKRRKRRTSKMLSQVIVVLIVTRNLMFLL